jgi:hypothetical protein
VTTHPKANEEDPDASEQATPSWRSELKKRRLIRRAVVRSEPYVAYLLREILESSHIENGRIIFDPSPVLLDDLSAWDAENEDLEEDDPGEDTEPLEDGHDREDDIWLV